MIFWQVDAFTNKIFSGNPAAVFIFNEEPSADLMMKTDQITQIIGLAPEYIGSNGEDCMAVVSNDETVRSFSPDYQKICALVERGFLLTAKDKSGEFDYIYRGFFPKLDVPEDPVTGSANTCLAAYWSKKLNKQHLKARQVSERGGTFEIEILQDRVLITGEAVTVFKGEMDLGEDQTQ